MYRDFYGLSEEPFRLTPDARFCFRHRSFAKARSYFQYALDHGEGFVLVTGRPGTGKTMLIDDLLAELAESRRQAVRIESAQIQADDLIRRIAYGFGLDPTDLDKATILNRLEQRLDNRSQGGKRVLLIVDEAQILSVEALEELRLLTNLRPHGQSLIQIFLVGQEGLRDLIRLPKLEQLHQRVLCACHLDPLTLGESREYIAYRLECAAWAGDPVIEAAVVKSFHRASEGIPRLINKLMDRLLLHGWLERRHRLGADDARTVLEELRFELLFAAAEDEELSESLADDLKLDITDIDRPSRIQDDQVTESRLELERSSIRGSPALWVLPEPFALHDWASKTTEPTANGSGFEDLFADPKNEDRFDGEGAFARSNSIDSPLSTLGRTSATGAMLPDSETQSWDIPRQFDPMASLEPNSSCTLTRGRTQTPTTGRNAEGESEDSRIRRSQGSLWLRRVFVFLILTALILGIVMFRSFPVSSDPTVDSLLGLGHFLGVRTDSPKDDSQDTLEAFEQRHGLRPAGPGIADEPTLQVLSASPSASDSPTHDVTVEALQEEQRAQSQSDDSPVTVQAVAGIGEQRADVSRFADPSVFSTEIAIQGGSELDTEGIRATPSSVDGLARIKATSGNNSEVADEAHYSGPEPLLPLALGLDLAELGLEHSEDNGRFLVNLHEFVLFDFDSSDLSLESQNFLRQLGAVFAYYPELKLQVLGHTDDIGDPRYNDTLSLRRAESVVSYLSGVGVAPDRLEPIGLGSHRPLISPDSPSFSSALRHHNRRIELAILP